MTDLIPNDLSHMSDEDFNALCPQGHHAPGPEPLSPAAQAVLDAAFGRWMEIDDIDDDIPGEIAAAVLRAAAKQSTFADVAVNKTIEVVPVDILLAIAAELEGKP
jgi:hypothetical protein